MSHKPEDILNRLKENEYAPIYFLYGPEVFYIDQITEYIEEKQFKNVEDPIKIYQVLCHEYLLNQEGKSAPKTLKIKASSYKRLGENKSVKILTFMTLFSLLLASVWWISKSSLISNKSKKPLLIILPFNNYIGSDTMDYFVDGMHSSLITDISKIGSIRVISETSSRKYKNSGKSISEIALELKADAIVEGSILCIEDSVCSQLRMYNAGKEETLIWFQDYKEDKSQILNWNNRVTKEISKKINVVLTPREEILLAKSRTVNPGAYETYLKGISHYQRLTKYDLEKAMQYYELAREIDPNFTLAYIGIASVWIGQMQMGYLPYEESDLKLKKAINKALELDSTIVEIHGLLAGYKCNRLWDWEGAGIEYKKAIELDPNKAGIHNSYSHYLAMIGRPEEGLQHCELAINLDPLNTLYKAFYGMALKNARHYDEAQDLLQRILKEEPEQRIALPSLWAVYHEKHMYPEALEIAKRIYASKGDNMSIESLESGYREGGYQLAMQRTAEMMIARSDTTFVTPWQIATLYTRAGMKDESLNWFEKAYEEHSSNMVYINVDPLFDILRNEDRFKQLIHLMNFPP